MIYIVDNGGEGIGHEVDFVTVPDDLDALDERRKKFLADVATFGDTLYGIAPSR